MMLPNLYYAVPARSSEAFAKRSLSAFSSVKRTVTSRITATTPVIAPCSSLSGTRVNSTQRGFDDQKLISSLLRAGPNRLAPAA